MNYKSDIQIIFLKNKQPCNYPYSNSDIISEYNVKYCKLKNENDEYKCALSLEIKKPFHSKFDNNKYLKKINIL
ncbi:MAG: hypothetical protein GY830_02885 [Bacteroidetes bacterium]|nr:hypothetical protein [Bacteroidota bacterium]